MVYIPEDLGLEVGVNGRALVISGPEEARVESIDLLPESAAAVLDVELAGICGTDVKIYSGGLPQPYPIVPGHEILGRIRSIAQRTAALWGVEAGDRVIVEGSIPCWSCRVCRSGSYKFCPSRRHYGTSRNGASESHLPGAVASGMRLASGSIVHPIAESVSGEAAVLASAVANGIAWVRQVGGAGPGMSVVVRGAGAQGIACAAIAAHVGAAVVLVGLPGDEERLQLARTLAPLEWATADEDPTIMLRRTLGESRADLVVDVSGDAAAFDDSVSWLRPQGRLVFAGLSGKQSVVNLDEIVWREIDVQGVFTKNEQAMLAAIQLIEQNRIPFEHIVTHRIGLDGAVEALNTLHYSPVGQRPLKIVIDPQSRSTLTDVTEQS